MARASRRKRRGDAVAPVHPSAGIGALYRRKLLALVDEMATSVAYWLKATYRANAPAIAMDSAITSREVATKNGPRWVAHVDGNPLLGSSGKPRLFKTRAAAEKAALAEIAGAPVAAPTARIARRLPAAELQWSVDELAVRWQGRFDEAAPELARYFARATSRRTDKALKTALDKGGFTVDFRMTPASRDILKATTQQNVALIKSIPQEYLTGVQGDVMRSVQTGRDLASLTRSLQDKYGVTRRRAELISRDQNNKATSAMLRARQVELGITKAIWVHSGGGKHPRPKHVAADGREYDVTKGLPIGDKGQYVFPGEEINCRCVMRSVIPGFSDVGEQRKLKIRSGP